MSTPAKRGIPPSSLDFEGTPVADCARWHAPEISSAVRTTTFIAWNDHTRCGETDMEIPGVS